MSEESLQDQLQDVQQRLDRLEQYSGIKHNQRTPGFDPFRFQQALGQSVKPLWISVTLALVLLALSSTMTFVVEHLSEGAILQSTLLGLPLFTEGFSGEDSSVTWLSLRMAVFAMNGVGLVSFGGVGVGVVAVGGFAVGIVAIGGGAIGIVSFGGGSLGVISFGEGAVGYMAIGGGGYGRYVLATEGKGRYVFDRKRQDPEAVELFCRWFPRLREVFTQEAAAGNPFF